MISVYLLLDSVTMDVRGFRWRCRTFYTFIYSNNCHPNVKIGQDWQKIQVNLAIKLGNCRFLWCNFVRLN